jgi:ABC-type dipeptide/oligopeptide/nickel transport system ATPase subunit
LRRKVENLYNRGLTLEKIVKTIFPKPSTKALLMEEFSGGEWSRMNIVKALLGLE